MLNAIVGCNILPSGCTSGSWITRTSNYIVINNVVAEACSAAAVKLSYENIDYYEIGVEFMTETEWDYEQVYYDNNVCFYIYSYSMKEQLS